MRGGPAFGLLLMTMTAVVVRLTEMVAAGSSVLVRSNKEETSQNDLFRLLGNKSASKKESRKKSAKSSKKQKKAEIDENKPPTNVKKQKGMNSKKAKQLDSKKTKKTKHKMYYPKLQLPLKPTAPPRPTPLVPVERPVPATGDDNSVVMTPRPSVADTPLPSTATTSRPSDVKTMRPSTAAPQDSTDPPTTRPTLAPVAETSSPQAQPTQPPAMDPVCGDDEKVFYGSSGSGGLYSFFQFCGGSLRGDSIGEAVVEIVIDPVSNRAFAQSGRPVFEFFEFDLATGERVPGSTFSTASVNQFHALEFVNGKLYGGGWQHLGSSNWEGSSLYEIDPASQTFTEIGPTGHRPLSGLAWTGQVMYGVSGAGWPPSELYEIDLETGEATIICDDLAAGFGSLIYYAPEGLLYGGTSDGNVAQIVPETCEVLNIDTTFAWSASFRPVTGLSLGCPT